MVRSGCYHVGMYNPLLLFIPLSNNEEQILSCLAKVKRDRDHYKKWRTVVSSNFPPSRYGYLEPTGETLRERPFASEISSETNFSEETTDMTLRRLRNRAYVRALSDPVEYLQGILEPRYSITRLGSLATSAHWPVEWELGFKWIWTLAVSLWRAPWARKLIKTIAYLFLAAFITLLVFHFVQPLLKPAGNERPRPASPDVPRHVRPAAVGDSPRDKTVDIIERDPPKDAQHDTLNAERQPEGDTTAAQANDSTAAAFIGPPAPGVPE